MIKKLDFYISRTKHNEQLLVTCKKLHKLISKYEFITECDVIIDYILIINNAIDKQYLKNLSNGKKYPINEYEKYNEKIVELTLSKFDNYATLLQSATTYYFAIVIKSICKIIKNCDDSFFNTLFN